MSDTHDGTRVALRAALRAREQVVSLAVVYTYDGVTPCAHPAETSIKCSTIALEIDVAKHAEGSCLAKFGDTHVLCTASVEQRVPPWMRDSGKGWVTAEYGMLPRSTHTRTDREAARGKQSGRTWKSSV